MVPKTKWNNNKKKTLNFIVREISFRQTNSVFDLWNQNHPCDKYKIRQTFLCFKLHVFLRRICLMDGRKQLTDVFLKMNSYCGFLWTKSLAFGECFLNGRDDITVWNNNGLNREKKVNIWTHTGQIAGYVIHL